MRRESEVLKSKVGELGVKMRLESDSKVRE